MRPGNEAKVSPPAVTTTVPSKEPALPSVLSRAAPEPVPVSATVPAAPVIVAVRPVTDISTAAAPDAVVVRSKVNVPERT